MDTFSSKTDHDLTRPFWYTHNMSSKKLHCIPPVSWLLLAYGSFFSLIILGVFLAWILLKYSDKLFGKKITLNIWKKIILFIGIIITSGIIAFTVFPNPCAKFNYGRGQKIIIENPIIKITDTDKNEDMGWQTYSNDDFSFNYPSDLSISLSERAQGRASGVSAGKAGPTQGVDGDTQPTETWDGVSFSVYKWPIADGSAYDKVKSEHDFIVSECPMSDAGVFTPEIEETSIDGQSGYRFSDMCRGASTYIAVEKGDFVYEFLLSYGNVKNYMGKYRDLTEKILSTFRFKRYQEKASTNTYKKKLFEGEEFYYGKPFPDILTNIKDEDLVGLSCSRTFRENMEGEYLYYDNVEGELTTVPLEDQELIDFINKQNDIHVSQISKCLTENNETIIIFSEFKGGGGGANRSFVGYIDIPVDLYSEIKASDYEGAYFGCTQPLARAYIDAFYVLCGSGDGSHEKKSVVAFYLNAHSYQIVYTCETNYNQKTYQSETICK